MEALSEILPKDKGWFGHTGLRALAQEQRQLESKMRRGRHVAREDHEAIVNIERTRRELHALGRARAWGDKHGKMHPLNLVRRQANELHADGLDLRCLDPLDFLAVRAHWPEWEVGQDIDLSVLPVSQRTPERDGHGDKPDDVESNSVADAGPETPNPFV